MLASLLLRVYTVDSDHNDRVEIAPGVNMPLINLGGISAAYSNGTFASNHTYVGSSVSSELNLLTFDVYLISGSVTHKQWNTRL